MFYSDNFYSVKPLKQPVKHQKGVVLAVSLLLLLVVTIVGLAAISGTTLQEKMSGNMYDREVAFQSAEASLRVAETQLGAGAATIYRDCSVVTCEAVPPSGATWQTVGTGAGGYNPGPLAAGQPQYIVEDMGDWIDYESSTGFGQSANANQYGAQGVVSTVPFYRITARSHNPASVSNRSVVTLQTWVKM